MPGAGARYFKNVGDIRLDSIVISYKAFCWILYCNFFFKCRYLQLKPEGFMQMDISVTLVHSVN